MDKEFTLIGKIANTHGLEGKLNIQHKLPAKVWNKIEFVFVELVHESYIPYLIVQKKPLSPTEILISLENIDQMETAKQLINKAIYLPNHEAALIIPQNQVDDYLIGFSIIDEQLGNIGNIHQLIELPNQVLAQIINEEKEILIPMHETFIKQINLQQKKVYMNLPHGLLDVYK